MTLLQLANVCATMYNIPTDRCREFRGFSDLVYNIDIISTYYARHGPEVELLGVESLTDRVGVGVQRCNIM